MNHFAGFPHPVAGGYHAMLRFARDGAPKPVLGEKGHPVIHATEGDAWKAITKHLLAYFNGDLRRDGETLGSAMKAANDLFRAVSDQEPKVEHKGRRA